MADLRSSKRSKKKQQREDEKDLSRAIVVYRESDGVAVEPPAVVTHSVPDEATPIRIRRTNISRHAPEEEHMSPHRRQTRAAAATQSATTHSGSSKELPAVEDAAAARPIPEDTVDHTRALNSTPATAEGDASSDLDAAACNEPSENTSVPKDAKDETPR